MSSGCMFSLLINMLINIKGLLPAVVLIVLHFCIDLSIWWSALAVIIWLAVLIVKMLFISFLSKLDSVPTTNNKNKKHGL